MGEPVYMDKAKVIAQLRSRQLHARASWVRPISALGCCIGREPTS